MKNTPLSVDTNTLTIAMVKPLIAAIVLGMTSLFHIYLGFFLAPAITLLQAGAGAIYMKTLLDTGKRPLLLNAAFNGAILGGGVTFVYRVVTWLSSSIAQKDWSSLHFNSLTFVVLEGAFIAFLGALAWFSYKTHIDDV